MPDRKRDVWPPCAWAAVVPALTAGVGLGGALLAARYDFSGRPGIDLSYRSTHTALYLAHREKGRATP